MSDFFVDPSAVELTSDIKLAPVLTEEPKKPKIELKKIAKKGGYTFYKVSQSQSQTQTSNTPSVISPAKTNVSDLLNGNDVDVAIEPDTEGNIVYVTLCGCGNNITFCKIM